MAHFCKAPARPINQVPGTGAIQACYGCGENGHFKRDFPKAKNAGGTGRLLAIGHEEAMADRTVVTGMFLLNKSYACILFDSGAKRSFVNQEFKHLLNQTAQALKQTSIVEMANGKTETSNEIFIGCTVSLNSHSFSIDLMLVSIKSFDVIVGMDWLSLHHADILCFEKAVRLHLSSNETLVICGHKTGTSLRIISSMRAQKHLRK
ncbi:hypothetical protein Lser_V15G34876 [Lactuca serriola]